MWQDLTEVQKTAFTVMSDARETDSVEEGIIKYRLNVDRVVNNGVDTDILARCLDTVSQHIATDQSNILKGRASRGRPQSWALAYVSLSADKLAFIALRSLLQHSSHRLTFLAHSISKDIQLEHKFEEIKRINNTKSKEVKGFTRNLNERLTDSAKIKKLYKTLVDQPLKWSHTECVGLGTRLIKACIESTGMWEQRLLWVGKKSTYSIDQIEELSDHIAHSHSNLELLSPSLVPMCCPPLDWHRRDGVLVGGYRFIQKPMIRTTFKRLSVDNDLDTSSNVVRALNAIQAVEWEVDKETLSLAKHIMGLNRPEYDKAISSVTARPLYPPYSEDMTKADRKVWFHNRDVARATWDSSVSKRLSQLVAVTVADKCKDAPLFFPHSLDWRGRVYPISTRLSPQGSDLQKALLRFSRKKPLGVYGLRILKLWAAGCAGIDKVSLSDRLKWFEEHYPHIKDFDYDNDTRWVDYDSPFLFVQAAIEIRNAVRSGHPESFMSSVSVCVDGSQNGLQHLSAIGRDHIGGASVNLVDQPVPADLYSDVAALVASAIEGDRGALILSGVTTDEVGQPLPPLAWFDTFNHKKKRRSAVKRSVLAYPYGVTKAGMCEGLQADGITNDILGSRHKNAWYLATQIDLAVRDVVVSAGHLMDWFRGVARLVATNGSAVNWIAPSGFPVNMHYLVVEGKIIRTCLGKLTIKQPVNMTDVDLDMMVRGIVANFIHSLDASHLIMSCLASVDDGITDLHFIHDSYGTHACDIDRVGYLLRREFVLMHNANPLEKFIEGLGFEVAPPPPQGKLNLDEVLLSKYFFA